MRWWWGRLCGVGFGRYLGFDDACFTIKHASTVTGSIRCSDDCFFIIYKIVFIAYF